MNKTAETLTVMFMALLGLAVSLFIYGTHLNTNKPKKPGIILYDSIGIKYDTLAIVKLDTNYIPIDTSDYTSYEKTDKLGMKDYHALNRARDLYMNLNPWYAFWIMAFSILISFSFGFIFPVLKFIGYVINEFYIKWYWILLSFILAICYVFVSAYVALGAEFSSFNHGKLAFSSTFIMEEFGIMLDSPKKVVMWLIGLASISSILAITGFFIILFSLNQMDKLKGNIDVLTEKFKLNVEVMNRLLLVLGISITGTVVATMLLRKAVMGFFPESFNFLFPVEFVYIYGLTYTIFLGIAYIPLYFQLKNMGTSILHSNEIKEIQDKEKSEYVSKVFKLKASSVDTIQIIISLLAPALTGFLGNILSL